MIRLTWFSFDLRVCPQSFQSMRAPVMASIRSSGAGHTSTTSKPMIRRPERVSVSSSQTAWLNVRPPETGVPVWGQFSKVKASMSKLT